MATLTFSLSTALDNSFRQMQEADQVAASETDGWVVAKTAAANDSEYLVGTKRAASTFSAESTTPKPGVLATGAAANAFKTQNPYSGTFDLTAWTITFAARANTASSQAGRVRCRVFASVNADGTGARELTGATQVGSTSAALSTTADVTSVVTWTPASAITLNNEYVFFVLAWEITTAAGSNQADVVFRTGTATSGTRAVTGNFTSITLISKTGGGISGLFSGTVKRITLSKTGGEIGQLVAGALKSETAAKTGGAISTSLAGGTKIRVNLKTGGSISGALAGGTKVYVALKIGGAISSSIAGGIRPGGAVKTGGASSSATTGAVKGIQQSKTGGSISGVVAGGPRSQLVLKIGGGKSSAIVGISKSSQVVKVGGSVSFSIAGATESIAIAKIGGGISLVIAGATYNIAIAEQGGGISALIGGGSKAVTAITNIPSTEHDLLNTLIDVPVILSAAGERRISKVG